MAQQPLTHQQSELVFTFQPPGSADGGYHLLLKTPQQWAQRCKTSVVCPDQINYMQIGCDCFGKARKTKTFVHSSQRNNR